MSYETPTQSVGETPPEPGFETARAYALMKFNEALHKKAPGFSHYVTDNHPDTGKPIATFSLAEDYDLASPIYSEILVVSVPITESGPIAPLQSTDPSAQYFLLRRPGDLDGQIQVDSQSYAELFENSSEPPVDDLEAKLWAYDVIPILKYF